MENFIKNARQVLTQVRPGQKPGHELARQELCDAQVQSFFKYEKPSDRARANLYFFLEDLAALECTEKKAESVLADLYRIHAIFARMWQVLRMDAIPVLSAMFALPPVDMAQLVNHILRDALDPGFNRVLVYQRSTQSLVLGQPSATQDSGMAWQTVGNCPSSSTLLAQFEQVAIAVEAAAQLDEVTPWLNSEGHTGPVVGWGGH